MRQTMLAEFQFWTPQDPGSQELLEFLGPAKVFRRLLLAVGFRPKGNSMSVMAGWRHTLASWLEASAARDELLDKMIKSFYKEAKLEEASWELVEDDQFKIWARRNHGVEEFWFDPVSFALTARRSTLTPVWVQDCWRRSMESAAPTHCHLTRFANCTLAHVSSTSLCYQWRCCDDRSDTPPSCYSAPCCFSSMPGNPH